MGIKKKVGRKKRGINQRRRGKREMMFPNLLKVTKKMQVTAHLGGRTKKRNRKRGERAPLSFNQGKEAKEA